MPIPHIRLDKKSATPLYRQVSSAIQNLISQGKLAPDTKLPSVRQLAQALDINTTTVVSAYKQLEQEMSVYSVVGSGTFVARQVVASATLESHVSADNIEGYINFADTTTDAALFPVTAFRRAFDAVLDRDGGLAFECHDNRGFAPLRESLCRLLDGCTVEPNCIQIVPDSQQGIEIIANELLSPGDTVFVEGFTSQGGIEAFLSRRAQIVEMPLTKDGPDFVALDALLKKHRPKLIHVMPNFQTPTGATYSEESKAKLIQLAQSAGAYILEEDQLSDFYYDGVKRTSLKAIDSSSRVIYIKSFSKIISQGLGIGFIALPKDIGTPKLAPPIVSGYIQRGFDLFLRSGAYDLHMANMRSVYGRRYQKMEAAAKAYLGHLGDFKLPGGGLSLWIKPFGVIGDYIEGFLQRKVVVSPGRIFSAGGGDADGFRISFASVPEERIAEGVGIIAAVLEERKP